MTRLRRLGTHWPAMLKVLCKVALLRKYIGALTFANLCQAYNDAFATVLRETGAGGGALA